MEPELIGMLFLVIMLVVIVLGVHVAWGLGILGILGMLLIAGPKMVMNQLGNMPYNLIGSYGMAAVPLFVFMGILAAEGGIAADAFAAARIWIGRLRGGLAIATTAAAAMFGAVSGSTLASSALFSKIAFPEMIKQGYDKRLAAGCIAASGTIAAMIPPSILLVLYGIISEVSIGKLLIGGIVPGTVMALTYMIFINIYAHFKPEIAPIVVQTEKVSWGKRIKVTGGVVPIAVIFFLIIGGMFTGIFTPTEGAAIGACITLFVVLAMRRLGWHSFFLALKQSVLTSVGLKLIIIGGYFFSRMLVISGAMKDITVGLLGLPVPSVVVIIAVLILLVFAGMVMVPIVMLVIFVPMLLPAFAEMGYDPVWFGIMFVTMCELGCITPPIALNLYVVKTVLGDDIDTMDIIRGSVWFVILDIFNVVLLFIFPQIALWLPGMMFK